MKWLIRRCIEPIFRWSLKDVEKVLCALSYDEWTSGYSLYTEGVTMHHRVYPLLRHLVDEGYARDRRRSGEPSAYVYQLSATGKRLKGQLESGELSRFPL